jgi:hypothetical protein
MLGNYRVVLSSTVSVCEVVADGQSVSQSVWLGALPTVVCAPQGSELSASEGM